MRRQKGMPPVARTYYFSGWVGGGSLQQVPRRAQRHGLDALHAARCYGAHAIAYSSAGPGARRDGTGDGQPLESWPLVSNGQVQPV